MEIQKVNKATFAGGCFWCMQPDFDASQGVLKTQVGYTGGTVPHPSYEQVITGTTGHAEAIEITFDLQQITYEALLEIFWQNINPTQKNGQFFDRGSQYRTAIFFHDENQHQAALKSKQALEASDRFQEPIATEIIPATEFYPAETYHQKYYQKNTSHYQAYKIGSGRQAFLEKTWKKIKP